MKQVTENNIYRDLILAWKKGWPDYKDQQLYDFPGIYGIATKVCSRLNLDIDVEQDNVRMLQGITNIAIFCSKDSYWITRRLPQINYLFHLLYADMKNKQR